MTLLEMLKFKLTRGFLRVHHFYANAPTLHVILDCTSPKAAFQRCVKPLSKAGNSECSETASVTHQICMDPGFFSRN